MTMKKLGKKAPIVLGVILAGGISFLNLSSNAENDLAQQNIKTDTSVEEVAQTNMKVDEQTKTNTVEVTEKLEETKKEELLKLEEEKAQAVAFTSKETVKERENLNNFLFIGDSYTYLLKDTIKANNENVYIHAKSGSRPSYWLDKVSSMPDNESVEGVVLLIGVNGASTDANKKDVVTLMNKLSEKYPDKKVYVQKIFHVGENFHAKGFNDKIDVLNEIIESHVNTLDNFTFIDTTTDLIDENGYLKYTYDELHIDNSKNDVFYGNILKEVQKAEQNL